MQVLGNVQDLSRITQDLCAGGRSCGGDRDLVHRGTHRLCIRYGGFLNPDSTKRRQAHLYVAMR